MNLAKVNNGILEINNYIVIHSYIDIRSYNDNRPEVLCNTEKGRTAKPFIPLVSLATRKRRARRNDRLVASGDGAGGSMALKKATKPCIYPAAEAEPARLAGC
ncbi:hypothetical protein GCM10011342_29820 [Aquisalinus flavus]|uniref:Uncharacterized protein n=1 Tax=Aquisalinus flavus TaxID=1526572 RepID=A0A8J2V5C9_9PROT|nr:hypothetical protein [Aquisalinus flavus]MBD0428038.1 hypothetical protein [Aquisalinus flavus]GGD19174.1 hypothetical protein GCM10011342_29820 [Aquisalinus flavus]